jgi:hypothetical protein
MCMMRGLPHKVWLTLATLKPRRRCLQFGVWGEQWRRPSSKTGAGGSSDPDCAGDRGPGGEYGGIPRTKKVGKCGRGRNRAMVPIMRKPNKIALQSSNPTWVGCSRKVYVLNQPDREIRLLMSLSLRGRSSAPFCNSVDHSVHVVLEDAHLAGRAVLRSGPEACSSRSRGSFGPAS